MGGEDDFEVPDLDYYAILCISREATKDDIRNAFLALSRVFHPDKQPTHQDEANVQYPRIDRAYKVLSNEVLRKTYDDYGESGLQALEHNQELMTALGAHLKTAEEMSTAVEDLLHEKQLDRLYRQLRVNSFMTCQLDAQDFVANPKRGLQSLFSPDSRLVNVDRMLINQSTSIPLNADGTRSLILGGYILSAAGLSHGAFTTSYQHIFQDQSSAAISLVSGWAPKLSVELSQPVSKYARMTLKSEISDEMGYDMSIGAAQQLYQDWHGSLHFGPKTGMETSLEYAHERIHASASAAAGPRNVGVSAQCKYHAVDSSTYKVGVELGPNPSVAVSSSRQLSKRSKGSLRLTFALSGLSLKFGLDRGSIRFAFPIALCPMSTSNATTMVWAVVSPFLISAIVNQIVRPKQKLRREKAMQHAAQQRLSYLTDARKTALMQQELMKTIAAEHTQQEREKETGLIILVARYGKNPSKCPIRHAEQSEDGQAVHAINLDVTIPLQFFILNSQVELPAGPKRDLLGFYNPCYGQSDLPELYVRYAIGNRVFEVHFRDGQKVIVPAATAKPMGLIDRVT